MYLLCIHVFIHAFMLESRVESHYLHSNPSDTTIQVDRMLEYPRTHVNKFSTVGTVLYCTVLYETLSSTVGVGT